MKKLIAVLVSVFFLEACIVEEEARYIVSYKNDSGVTLTLHRFDRNNENRITLASNEVYEADRYIQDAFYGDISSDSLVIVFPNGKGYSCDYRINDSLNKKCISNSRDPLNGLGFTALGDNHYQFTITEEDYLNAKDLD